MPIAPILTAETYTIERDICDKASAYAESIMAPNGKRIRNWMSAAECAHPNYATCNNDMRSRVEQYEILTNPPDAFVAYMGAPDRDATNYRSAQPWPVTTWCGHRLGHAFVSAKWRVISYTGTHMHQFTAYIAGREYTGRGFGEGLCVSFRLTAAAKRKIAA